MAHGLKHLVTCRCVLPQFKRTPNPPDHQFIVFSVIKDDETVEPKFAQCNNCGVVHKVIDVCRSEIVVGREAMGSLVTIEDVKVSLPANLATILESNDADLASWEAAQFAIENKKWGSFVVLKTDEESGLRQGKYVRILSETMFKVESFTREEITK